MNFIFAFAVFFAGLSSWGKVNSDSGIFLPEGGKESISVHMKAPILWWNFLIYDSSRLSKEKACEFILSLPAEKLFFNPCTDLPMPNLWLDQWGLYQTLTHPPPPSLESLNNSLDRAIVQLSLPVDSDSLNVLRKNPLASYQSVGNDLAQFFPSSTGNDAWKTLPFLLSFSPENTLLTEQLFSVETGPIAFFAGPHIGQWKNKSQIINDLSQVVVLGTSLLGLLFLFFILTKRYVYFLLIPILSLSIACAFLIVDVFWGSIHGLTLAFGCGLIGISMDYAFHGWKKTHDKIIWKSNFYSFSTSLIAFVTLGFFSTPLIQQLSLFAITGLSLSFLLSYLVSLFLIHRFPPSDLNLTLPRLPKIISFSIIGTLIVGSFMAFLSIKSDFRLQRMDFEAMSKPQVLDDSSFEKSKQNLATLALEENDSEKIKSLVNWSVEKNIPLLGPTSLPGYDEQKLHFRQWKKLLCEPDNLIMSASRSPRYKKLFNEFFANLNCQSLEETSLSKLDPMKPLFSVENKILFLLNPETLQDRADLRTLYPETFFLSDLTRDWPTLLKKEIQFYFSLICLLAMTLLAFFFKKKAPLAILPTLGGWCGILIAHSLFSIDLSFISFISVLILFGLTLDYGIFVTSYLTEKRHLNPVFNSIILS